MPQKHALIIGIHTYLNLESHYQLRGCVNDARLVRQVLGEHFGFADADIFSLHNEQATRERILAEMERLVAVVGPDDVVAFHFSGHGSRRTQQTIPRQMWNGIREQISPAILAVATILVVMSIGLLASVELLRRRSDRLRGVTGR